MHTSANYQPPARHAFSAAAHAAMRVISGEVHPGYASTPWICQQTIDDCMDAPSIMPAGSCCKPLCDGRPAIQTFVIRDAM